MPQSKPPELVRCHDHGLVMLEEPGGGHLCKCVACELGLEARPDETHDTFEQRRLTDNEFRNRIDWETLEELVPLMEEYLDDKDEGPIHATHAAWEGELPAGYTEQHRFVLVISYRWDAMVKHIIDESSARQTIEALRTAGYGDDV